MICPECLKTDNESYNCKQSSENEWYCTYCFNQFIVYDDEPIVSTIKTTPVMCCDFTKVSNTVGVNLFNTVAKTLTDYYEIESEIDKDDISMTEFQQALVVLTTLCPNITNPSVTLDTDKIMYNCVFNSL